jgi:uracil phosphoribosyltransferase
VFSVLNNKPSILDDYLMQIRDINIQKNRLLLSQNLESLSMFLGYEISKQLDYENREITTQLGVLDVPLI